MSSYAKRRIEVLLFRSLFSPLPCCLFLYLSRIQNSSAFHCIWLCFYLQWCTLFYPVCLEWFCLFVWFTPFPNCTHTLSPWLLLENVKNISHPASSLISHMSSGLSLACLFLSLTYCNAHTLRQHNRCFLSPRGANVAFLSNLQCCLPVSKQCVLCLAAVAWERTKEQAKKNHSCFV